MADIQIRNLFKRFDGNDVLKSIDIDIPGGSFVTIVGPSGCGKSTLLRIIAGLETPDSGDIQLGGKSIIDMRASDRDLAMVFQSYALYPHLTVAQNMITPLRLRSLNRLEHLPVIGRFWPGYKAKLKAMQAIIQETASTLQIEDLLTRKPSQLSGGQRQRVALGRAMVRKPVAFLMDEPLSNLDASLRVHMRSELVELHRNLGATFIYVTHDQAEALTMSDQVVVMMDGEVLQIAPPQEIYGDPADFRVASFIGSPRINALPGQCDDDGRLSVLGVPLKYTVGVPKAELSVAVRPEHCSLHSTTDQLAGLQGQVVHHENLGSDVFIHVITGDGQHKIITRSRPQEAKFHPEGSQVEIRFDPPHVMVFKSDNSRVTCRFDGS